MLETGLFRFFHFFQKKSRLEEFKPLEPVEENILNFFKFGVLEDKLDKNNTSNVLLKNNKDKNKDLIVLLVVFNEKFKPIKKPKKLLFKFLVI